MPLYPVGIRKEMKTQLFREAQSAPPEKSSFYMQNGSSAPVLNQEKMDQVCDSAQDVKEFVISILSSERVGIPQRIIDKKLENLVSYSISSSGDMNGFFIIPTHTGSKKIGLEEARKIVAEFEKKFQCDCEIEHGKNFKIKFKSIPKNIEQAPQDDEGSLKFVPDEKGSAAKKTASSVFAEQIVERKNILYNTLRKIGFGS